MYTNILCVYVCSLFVVVVVVVVLVAGGVEWEPGGQVQYIIGNFKCVSFERSELC